MSKKFFTALIIFFGIIITAALVWFLFFYQNGQKGVDIGLTVVEYLPFGRLTGTNNNQNQGGNNNGSGGNNGNNLPTVLPALRQIAAGPIAGFTILRNSTSTATVRYMEIKTGNIYDSGINGEESRRITNTTIPRVHEAMFLDKGETVIARYLSDDNLTIETYSASIPKLTVTDTEGKELRGIFLAQNIQDLVFSPDTKKIFYLSDAGGGAIGQTSTTNGGSKSQIFSSAIRDWLSYYPNERTITLTTKPSGSIEGYVYQLNVNNKNFEKIFGGIAGLTTLMSPDGNLVFFSTSGERGISNGIYNVKDRKITQVSVGTISDKCTWNSSSTKIYCGIPDDSGNLRLPDSWYQGKILFSDKIWSIDSSGIAEMLVDIKSTVNEPIDVIKPMISPDEKRIFFINKQDLSLWLYEIKK